MFCFVLNHFEINDERQNKKIKERRMREGKEMGFITHWGADRPVLLLLQCDLWLMTEEIISCSDCVIIRKWRGRSRTREMEGMSTNPTLFLLLLLLRRKDRNIIIIVFFIDVASVVRLNWKKERKKKRKKRKFQRSCSSWNILYVGTKQKKTESILMRQSRGKCRHRRRSSSHVPS